MENAHFNNQQADGPTRDALAVGAEAPKWAAFGWYAQEVDGNDLDALVAGTLKQQRLTRLAPRQATPAQLRDLFQQSLRYW